MFGRRRFLGGAAGLGAAGILGPATFGVLSAGCSSGKSNEWLVGAFLSLTGEDAKFGEDTKAGIELAVAEINAAGGIKGKPMKVLYEDDKSTSGEATIKVQQLIDRDKVVALLGEVASSRSIPGGIVATKRGIPMISPSSTNADVTKNKDFVFRVCFVDEFQGRMGAEFAVKTLGKKRVGVAFAEDDVYSQGLADEFKKAVAALGGEIVAEAKFTQKEQNFTTFARELKAKNPEIIYAPIYYSQMLQLGRHAKDVGIGTDMWLGADGWSGEVELLKELNGAYFTDHHAPDLPWEPSKKFVAAYKEKNSNKEPSSLAAMGYDAAKVLADAIKRAKEDTPKGIRDAITETKDFPGASGIITIDKDRNAEKPIVVSQIREGSAHYAAVVGPNADKILAGATPPAVTSTPATAAPSTTSTAAAPATSGSAAPATSAAPAASGAPSAASSAK